jgi:hypothetical protein
MPNSKPQPSKPTGKPEIIPGQKSASRKCEANVLQAGFWPVRIGYNPIQNGQRHSLRTLIQQSTSRVEEASRVLPESILF